MLKGLGQIMPKVLRGSVTIIEKSVRSYFEKPACQFSLRWIFRLKAYIHPPRNSQIQRCSTYKQEFVISLETIGDVVIAELSKRPGFVGGKTRHRREYVETKSCRNEWLVNPIMFLTTTLQLHISINLQTDFMYYVRTFTSQFRGLLTDR